MLICLAYKTCNGKSWKYSLDVENWTQAVHKCATAGDELAILRNDDDHNCIKTIGLPNNSWVGFSNDVQSNVHVWLNGQPVIPENFSRASQCGFVNTNGNIGTDSCARERRFVCQRPERK